MADRGTTLSRRRAVWLAAGVAAVAIWLLNGPSSGADLGSPPEAELRYPTSHPLSEGSQDRVDDALGTTNAAWWMILGTEASMEDVLRFYEGKLTVRG